MLLYTPPRPTDHVPLIDLSRATDDAGKASVARELHDACRQIGFFYITGHGLSPDLIAQQFAWAQRFFDLPLPDKEALNMKRSPSGAGYEPLGAQRLDSQDANSEAAPPDLKEAFYCGMEIADDHPFVRAGLRSYGRNQWPHALPDFKAQMLAYQAAVQSVGERLMGLLALSLELPEDWFAPYFDTPSITLRLIKYPPHPDDAAFNQIGAGAHTDWGGITLLLQDDAGGLEVQTLAGEWIEAPPIAGSFVVNLGDLMARWTNGYYRSNLHRVRNGKSHRNRYSVPFFYSPRPDAGITCIPTCVNADHPPLYPPCTAGEHMAEMFRRSYGYAITG